MTIKEIKNKLINSNKKGFISIEAIISSVAILMCIYLAIGFFIMIYPRLALEKEVHALAQKAKIQGGLTDETSQPLNSDIEEFKNSLVKLGYKKDSIEIEAKTELGGNSIIGVTPINEPGDNYLKRDSKDKMRIAIRVPSEQFIQGPLKFFRIPSISTNKLKYNVITETVMSERW